MVFCHSNQDRLRKTSLFFWLNHWPSYLKERPGRAKALCNYSNPSRSSFVTTNQQPYITRNMRKTNSTKGKTQGKEKMLKSSGGKGLLFFFNSNWYLEDIQEHVASVKQEQADRNKETENKKEFWKLKIFNG